MFKIVGSLHFFIKPLLRLLINDLVILMGIEALVNFKLYMHSVYAVTTFAIILDYIRE